MNNLIKNIQAQSANQKAKPSVMQIADVVCALLAEVQAPRTTSAVLKPIQEPLISYLTSAHVLQSSSKALLKLIAKCIALVFELGDCSKMQASFIEPMATQINAFSSSQASCSERLARLYLLSKVFQVIKQSCFVGCPPTKELIDLYAKIAVKSNGGVVRVFCYQAITRVVKVGSQNISLVAADLIKNHVKMIDKVYQAEHMSSHQKIVAAECLKALTYLVNQSFSFSMVAQHYEQLSQMCLRNFHEPHINADRSYLAELLVELLTLRLEESKKQADIKSSFKKYQD